MKDDAREAAWKERLIELTGSASGRISLDAEMHRRIRDEFRAGWQAARAPISPAAQEGELTVDTLAQFIRAIDGDNTMGAGMMAERIFERFGIGCASSVGEPSATTHRKTQVPIGEVRKRRDGSLRIKWFVIEPPIGMLYAAPPESPEVVRADAMEDALQQIADWARAYPRDIFPEPDMAKAHAVLQEHGMTLAAISASNMRHVITQVQAIVDAALAARKTP